MMHGQKNIKLLLNNLYVSGNIIRVFNNKTNTRFPVHVEHAVDRTHQNEFSEYLNKSHYLGGPGIDGMTLFRQVLGDNTG